MMTDFSLATVEARIQAAIQPQLARCDELLDYYTEGLPREVWGPIADDLNPGRAERINFFVAYLSPDCPGCNP